MSSSFFDSKSEPVLMAACEGYTVAAETRHEAVVLARGCLLRVFYSEYSETPYTRRIIGGGVINLGHYQRCRMTDEAPESTSRRYWCTLIRDDGSSGMGTIAWAVPNVRETEDPNRPDPEKNHDSCPQTGNPISIATGAKVQRDVDVAPVGRNPLLRFTRRYSSTAAGTPSALGAHWRHTYSRRIETLQGGDTPSTVRLVRARGNRYTYRLQDDGQWTGDPDVRLELARTANGGWGVTAPDGTEESYDAAGRLIRLATPTGAAVTLHHAHNRLAEVRDPESGRTLTFHYDAAGRLTGLSGPDGNIEYTFDTEGRLAMVTHTDGRTRQYHYEDARHPRALTGITDETGNRYATWAYDELGRAVMSEHAGGADRTELAYHEDGATTVTSALGRKTTYHFETLHGVRRVTRVEGHATPSCEGAHRDHAYTSEGWLASKTDWNGTTTTYAYNPQGLEIERVEAAGTDSARTIETEWHPELRLPVRITEPRKVTEYDYDSRGLMLRRTERDRDSGVERTWTYTYNDFGLVASVDGPRTDVADITYYQYDAQGNLAATTNAAGHTTRVTASDPHGRPLVLVDANGLSTHLSYDARGRLISGDVGGEVTRFEYDGVGNLTRITLPDGSELAYEYDAAHRLVGMADQLGHRAEYTLDAAGNRVAENVYDETNTLARTRERVYDELGRMIRDIGAAGQTTAYGYDGNGNVIAATDPLGNTTSSAFDALNRLVEQTDPLGGAARYTYDAQDKLVSVMDPNGNTTTYTYDGLGNRIREDSPDAGVTRFVYDPAGNPTERTDAKGQTTRYRYDALNRLVEATYDDGTAARYDYDTAENGIGRLARITDPSGATEWDYDPHGRVAAKRQSIDGRIFETGYIYDAAGRLAAMNYPSGTRLEYGYADGRLARITVNGETLVSDIGYTPFGPVNGWRWGDGAYHSREFDQDGQLTAHTLAGDTRRLGYDPIGNITEIADRRVRQIFDYDALSRLTEANDADFHQRFVYDANGNRLELSEAGDLTTYRYSADSNRLMEVVAESRRDYQYDANGSTVADGRHTYTYNARNRLVAIDGGRTARYRHNALGQRVYKEVPVPGDANGDGVIDQNDIRAITGRNANPVGPGADCNGDGFINQRDVPCIAQKMAAEKSGKAGRGRVGEEDTSGPTTEPKLYFVYDEQGQLIGEYDQDGNAVREMVWLENLPIGLLTKSSLHHIHPDHLATPRAITSPTGTVVWRWDSDPFGTTAANDDPDGDGQRVSFNLRLPGQYYDGETGLHYNYFRDYGPLLGRYIESDPIGIGGGLNTYAYADSNALTNSDPLGLDYWCGPGQKRISIPGASDPRVGQCVDDPYESQRRKISITGDDKVHTNITNSQCVKDCMDDPKSTPQACAAAGSLVASMEGPVVGAGAETVCSIVTVIHYCSRRCEEEYKQCD